MNFVKRRLSPLIMSVLLIIWSLFVFIRFYNRYDFASLLVVFFNLPTLAKIFGHPDLLLSYISTAANLLALIFSSWILPAWFMARLKVESRPGLESFLLSVGLGLGGWSLLTFLLGLAGLLQPWLFRALLWSAFTISLGQFYLGRGWRTFKPQSALPVRDLFSICCLGIGVTVLAVNIISALAPETHFDTLFYHLAVPSLYKIHGRIFNIPFNSTSYFPQNIEMLYLLGLIVNNDTFTRLLHLLLGLGSSLVIYVIGRQYFSRTTGIVAAAIFYIIPQVALESWTAMTDLGLSFFVLLNLLCLLRWLEDKEKNIKFLRLAAILAGLAIGTKYTAAPLVVIGLFFILGGNTPGRVRLVEAGKFLLIVGIFIAPFLIKNYAFTGSPVAPFIMSPVKSPAHPDFQLATFIDDCGRPQSWQIKEMFIKPWIVVLDRGSLNSLAGPLFLLFLPLFIWLFIAPDKDLYTKYLLWYLGIYFIFWMIQTSSWRYIQPALPVYGLLVGSILGHKKIDKFNHNLLRAAIVAVLLGNLAIILVAVEKRQPFGVIAGVETRENYLSRSQPFYPNPVYSVLDFANKNLPAGVRILFVGETRGYYCQRDFIANCSYDVPTFQKYFKSAASSASLAQKLRQDGIEYIIFNRNELIRLQESYHFYDFQPVDLRLLRDFWANHSQELQYCDGVGLYRIF